MTKRILYLLLLVLLLFSCDLDNSRTGGNDKTTTIIQGNGSNKPFESPPIDPGSGKEQPMLKATSSGGKELLSLNNESESKELEEEDPIKEFEEKLGSLESDINDIDKKITTDSVNYEFENEIENKTKNLLEDIEELEKIVEKIEDKEEIKTSLEELKEAINLLKTNKNNKDELKKEIDKLKEKLKELKEQVNTLKTF